MLIFERDDGFSYAPHSWRYLRSAGDVAWASVTCSLNHVSTLDARAILSTGEVRGGGACGVRKCDQWPDLLLKDWNPEVDCPWLNKTPLKPK